MIVEARGVFNGLKDIWEDWENEGWIVFVCMAFAPVAIIVFLLATVLCMFWMIFETLTESLR